MYITLHVKCLLFLSDFNQIWNVSRGFKNPKFEIPGRLVRWALRCYMPIFLFFFLFSFFFLTPCKPVEEQTDAECRIQWRRSGSPGRHTPCKEPSSLQVTTLTGKIIGSSTSYELLVYVFFAIRVPSSHCRILSLAPTQFWNILKLY
jgi:hypothetical protein